MDFSSLSRMFLVEVDGPAARLILEKIGEEEIKGVHFIFGGNGTSCKILLTSGKPKAGIGGIGRGSHSHRWLPGDGDLLFMAIKLLADGGRKPFAGCTVEKPELLETYLSDSTALANGKWQVAVNESLIALLQRHGFQPQLIQ